MKPNQEAVETQTVPADSPATGSPQSGSGIRWVIRGVVVVVGGIICVAVGQTIGLDLYQSVRRLSIFRSTVRPATVEPLSSNSGERIDERVASAGSSNKRIAGDAQIAAPRRRKPASITDAASVVVANQNPSNEPQIPGNGEVHPGLEKMEAAPETAANHADASVDFTENLLDAAARLVSLSWQDFDYPVSWSAPETSKSRMLFVSNRNRLLKGTAHPHPSTLSLDQFRKNYALARAQFAEDPRLDYAFGLVLWKHGQHGEAIEMFQTAARLGETPFLPAALAVAWGRFLTHEERRGLDQLAHIARLLAANRDKYPTETQAEQAAICIGRALGYLSGPGRTSETAESVELTTRNILDRLPENLRNACETSRQQIGLRESELRQLASLPHEKIATDQQRDQKILQDKIDSLRKEMQVASDVLTRNHRTHVDAVQEILRGVVDVRGQIDKLRPTIERAKEEIRRLTEPKPHVEVIVSPPLFVQPSSPNTQAGGANSNGQLTAVQGSSTVLLPETPSERATRVAELTKARDELKKIESELSDLRDEQRELVASRNEADAKAKLEKDQVRRVRLTRIKEQQQMEKKLQTLSKALRRVSSLKDGLQTIAAYVPWNVEVEGEALSRALAPKPANPSR